MLFQILNQLKWDSAIILQYSSAIIFGVNLMNSLFVDRKFFENTVESFGITVIVDCYLLLVAGQIQSITRTDMMR